MKPRRAEFVTSASQPSEYPAPRGPEFAFVGRSNVGKSSLINSLVGHARLAKTSNTPGRTRLLNWFHIENGKTSIYFVDLPGYGYAKVPAAMRDSWRPMVESYLQSRSVLRCVFVLIDARRGVQDEETELFEWLQERGVFAQGVVTKTDKLAKNKRKPMALDMKKQLGAHRTPLITSAQEGDGLIDLWRVVENQCR